MRQLWWWGLLVVAVLAAGCNAHSGPAQSNVSDTSPTVQHTEADTPRPSAIDLLDTAIGDHRLVLLGEIHGTREIPALVGALVDRESARGNQVVLALEIIARDQARGDRYLRAPGTPADRAALLLGEHWREPMHDGRDSAAMFDLIEQVRGLRARGRDVAIVFFDPGNLADRNRGMADHLRAAVSRAPNARVLVLTGNVHAMTAAPPWQMFAGGKRIEPPVTAGRMLADLHPFSVDIEATTGEAWNCTGTCSVHPVTARSAGGVVPRLELQRPADSAWDAELLLPQFSASRPAIQ